MAAADESQGLKIAVAACVSLTVLLAVTAYFLYSAYSQAFERLRDAEENLRKKGTVAREALTRCDELRRAIGARAEEFEAVKDEIKAEQRNIDAEIGGLVRSLNESSAQAQAAGATGPELQDAKDKLQQIADAYLAEPNKNYISSMGRLKDLLEGVARVDREVARNDTALKRGLESANLVNQAKLDVATRALARAQADLEAEQKKHVEERESLVAKVDQLQAENGRQAAEVAALQAKSRDFQEEGTKKLALAHQIIRELRDLKEAKEAVLDRPDGYVTYVDYGRGEVRTNLTRGTGARPRMTLSIFDRRAPGIPTERPKATIELLAVAEADSRARIVATFDPIDPIRAGDLVYSPSWSPDEPTRFALIGPIDLDRDGTDDRAALKRMIEASGGLVDYDLPPPEAGPETGQLSARDAWYVTDDRPPFGAVGADDRGATSAQSAEFLKKRSEAVREARLNGVRPMPIERLLAYLGYGGTAPRAGRAEVVDRNALNRMLRPRDGHTPPRPPAATPGADAAPKPEAPKPGVR